MGILGGFMLIRVSADPGQLGAMAGVCERSSWQGSVQRSVQGQNVLLSKAGVARRLLILHASDSFRHDADWLYGNTILRSSAMVGCRTASAFPLWAGAKLERYNTTFSITYGIWGPNVLDD